MRRGGKEEVDAVVGPAVGEPSAVSGRAGHLITERGLLHHHQSHAGSHLPSTLLGLCNREGERHGHKGTGKISVVVLEYPCIAYFGNPTNQLINKLK